MREHCTARVRIPFKPNIFPGFLFTTFAHNCDVIQISSVVRTVAKKRTSLFHMELVLTWTTAL